MNSPSQVHVPEFDLFVPAMIGVEGYQALYNVTIDPLHMLPLSPLGASLELIPFLFLPRSTAALGQKAPEGTTKDSHSSWPSSMSH
jgi:hypothetical protein